MIAVDGYKIIQKLKQDRFSAQYEASDVLQSRRVLIVHLSTEGLFAENVKEIINSYNRLKSLKSENLVRIHDCRMIRTYNREDIAFICEMHGAKSLNETPKPARPDFLNFFTIAISLAEVANQLHQTGVLLKEINPSTLLLGNGAGHVLVNTPYILFASSSPISRRAVKELYDSSFINNVLPYISPEQTGRMNRQIDHRSDFYAFGALFYELLTGRTPFSSNDPFELIHSHIARAPISPTKIRMDIPEMLSRITLKLLAKMPEDRYQSAFGLLSDLHRCQKEYVDSSFISSFALGNRDAPEKLHISKKMFGREDELEKLTAIFEKVKSGSSEIFTVTGMAGIGKTRLVMELQAAVVEAGGYFGSGKYDPFHRNTPYSAIIDALRDILRKILGEKPEQLALWKEMFLKEMGPHATMIIEFIPELECILGPQPRPPAMPPDEAERRFLSTCVNFIKVFTMREQPLVIFMDDMQWADSASLVLFEHVLAGQPLPYCMHIGAYRDSEVNASHPLSGMIERIRDKGIPIGSVTLGPIAIEHVQQAIIDALSKNIVSIQKLSELVHLKTNGNPFFIAQFIQSLYLRKLLYFDFQTGVWRWNEQGIRAQAFTENVLELMSGELLNLSPEMQKVMKNAACIGNRFDFMLLAALSDSTIRDTAASLLDVIDSGYIVAKGEGYHLLTQLLTDGSTAENRYIFEQLNYDSGNHFEFLHDRVHQAVYDRLSIQYRRPLHLKIGQLLIKQIEQKKLQENIFTVVNQLNHGVDVIFGLKNRNEYARLYLMAGKKAKEGAAYQLATNYYNAGIAMLSDGCWEEDFELAFGLYKEKLECAFLGRRLDEAEHLFEFVAERTQSVMDKAALMHLRMVIYQNAGKHKEAITVGLDALRLLGHDISISRRSRTLMVKYIVLRIWLSRRRVQSLSKLPEISDPRNMLVMKLLLDLSISLYMSSPQLYIPLVFKIFEFTLKFGNSPATFLGLAVYGSLCAKFEAYELGNQLGEMALQAYEKFGQADSGAKLLLFYGAGISFWKHHISFSIKCLRKGLERAAEIGDLNFAMYYIQAILHLHFAGGAPLEDVDAECKKHYDLMAQTPDEAGARLVTSLRQTVKCLQGKTKSCVSLDDDAFSEADHMNRLEHGDVQSVIMRHYLLRLQLLFIMGDYEGALEMAQKTARLSIYNAGTFIVTEYYFYRCLSMLALYQQSSLPKQRHYKKKIRRYIAKFTKMAEHCPSNFEHKRLILIGENAHVKGKFEQAICRFSEAVTSARENGFIHMSAIANELSANSALKNGHPVLAKMFLEQAHADYLKWGADGKCKWLIERYPEFLRDKAASDTLPALRPIDYATVVNALQAISTEIVLDRLLKRLMKIVVENAGAQRVLFILKEGDQLDVKASGGTGGPIRITHQPMPVEKRSDLLLSGIHFVINTLQSIVIDDAVKDSAYKNDPYVVQHKPKSIFCLPVLRQNDLIAIVYLENSLVAGVFTPDRIEILQLIASQAAISIENARLYESLRQKERDLIDLSENLRSLSSELLLTEERERRRIAVDLHDRIGHALANIKLQLGDLKEDLNQPQGLPKMKRIAELVDQSIQDTQSLTFDLSPPVLYDLGLEAALEWLVDQMQEQYRISMVFEDDQQPKPLNESIRILAFQATRELLFNIVKHAHAHHAWVSIKRDEEWVHIEIKDDGVGLHASRQSRPTNRKTGGFGLFSIQERLKHFGGRLEMASEPGKGTQVTLIAPMQLH